MATAFQTFVNKELPKRIYTDEGPLDVSAGLILVTTGVGLGIETKTLEDFGDETFIKDSSLGVQFYWDGGSLKVTDNGITDASLGNKFYFDSSGLLHYNDEGIRDASISSQFFFDASSKLNIYDIWVREASLSTDFYWDSGELKTVTPTDVITDSSLSGDFLWQGGLLYVDVSGASDASLTTLYNKVGVYDYDSSEFITQSDSHTLAISELDRVLALLAPAPPDALSTKNLSNPGYYSAKAETSGTVRSNITDDTTPTSIATDFYKEVNTMLIGYVAGSVDGSIYVTSSDMQGISDGALTITADEDPYSGDTQKEGFYKQLSAFITTSSVLSAATTAYTYNMQYPDSGNETGQISFYVDAPLTPNITSENIEASVGTITRYISGVPSYATDNSINIGYDVNNAVGKFYNLSTIGNANMNAGDSANSGLPGEPYADGATVNVTGQKLTFGNNEYYENGNISVQITPYNSKTAVSGSSVSLAIPGRIDTVSNESSRLLSGSGTYPSSGYGGSFDSTISLKSGVYTNELQKLNNLYRYPTGDYSGWRSGPDYSTGVDSGRRWVTFSTSISSATSFTIQVSGAQNFTANAQQVTQDVSIYANVDGATPTNGWVDCNKPYDGVSNPTDDGDGAMKVGDSTSTYKSCTFGTAAKTGTLYVRIGLDYGSNERFVSVTI